MKLYHSILLSLALVFSTVFAEDKDGLNIATPDLHSYVRSSGNRAGHDQSGAEVNEARVYDFYQRQADYYMANGIPGKLLPAFPGLDGGLHGHWGKHNQNQHSDSRCNNIDMGSTWGHVIRIGKRSVDKGIAISLGDDASILSTCFDPETLSYPMVWEGGFIQFDPWRWGSSRNARPVGNQWFKLPTKTNAWSDQGSDLPFQYRGYFRHNRRVIFSYDLDGLPVFDSPSAVVLNEESVFTRTISLPKGFAGGTLLLGAFPKSLFVATVGGMAQVEVEKGKTSLVIPAQQEAVTIGMAMSRSVEVSQEAAIGVSQTDLVSFTKGGPPQWRSLLKTSGTIAADDGQPYVIDTIAIPTKTEFNSVMQITSLAFLSDGSALLTTLAGEMWKVSGLTNDLSNVTWKRFAAGLHQPIGIHIDEDGIFVLERGQITQLHDLNQDGEADYYETYANDFNGKGTSHTHSFGLSRGEDGSFYFVSWKDICRTSPDRKTDYYAFGVRNCMGFGSGRKGAILGGPQEGTYTPTSMVIDVQEGEFYGHPGISVGSKISPPLCFIPRGIDNSTGGFLYAAGDRWGPLSEQTIGLSYGYGSHYLVLRDDSTARHQGATVPLEGDFESGVMRGAIAPHDGQLYVVGLDGWGDYSVKDGCFQRVRYTGQPLRKPIGFQVHSNGIQIDFPIELDEKHSTEVANFFAQQWNYEYSKRYGSPEFSKIHPESLGHDFVEVRSVQLSDDGKSLFVEIPELEPVMQMHLRMHLVGADGVAFKTDLFPTILELGEEFSAPGLADLVAGKSTEITLRVRGLTGKSGSLDSESGEIVEGERTITLSCSGALQFETKLLEAKAGEPLKLVFKNPDIMPHNVIFVTEGNLQKVGNLSFSMLNDPNAADKHYTPDVPEVIAGTFLVQPNGSHILHFSAPEEPGDHHFVCTFPGHWMSMHGIFRVTQ